MRFLLAALAALPTATALVASPAAMAQSTGAGIHAGTLEVPVDKSEIVTSDRPIAKALIGSAEIADVLPVSNRSIYVLGKKVGTTSLTLYDQAGRVIAVMDVSVGPDVEGVRSQLAQLIPGQPIDVRLSNGYVVMTGTVSDPGAADRAAQIAKTFAGDKVVNMISVGSSQQVMLEVRFAEVDRQTGEQIGVSGFGLSRGGSFQGAIGDGAALDNTGLKLGAISDSFGILSKTFSLGNVDITATFNALERKGLAKILAEPTLVALSGERASFLAGGEFPIPVVQSGSNGGTSNAITVEYKPFGVSLAFTPTVLSDKVVSMVIEPEVSSIDPTASITINGLVVPGLQTRRANTTVQLRDGESFVIAGLLRRDFQTTVKQLPILGSIPIIGSLFRSTGFKKGDTELMIVVTPRLVQPIRPDQVRLPTDRVGDPKPIDVLIDGEGYHPKALAPSQQAVPIGAAPATETTPPKPQGAATELPATVPAPSASPTSPSPQASTQEQNGYAY